MDEERRTSIWEALQTYRERVKEYNVSLLQSVIDRVATIQASSNRSTTEQETQQRRYAVGFSSALQDLLADDDVRRGLTSRYDLDGVCRNPVDISTRSAWFAVLNNAIAALDLDANMPRPESLPAGLEFLCTLVNGIGGPGLPYWRELEQTDFVVALASEVGREKGFRTAARVTKGMRNPDVLDFQSIATHDLMLNWGDEIALNWQDWDISLSVRIGDSENSCAGTYVVFCRRLKPVDDLEDYYDEDEVIDKDEWKEGDDVWQWKYGTHDSDWESRLFARVEDFLFWYAHCKDPRPDEYHITSLALEGEAKPAGTNQ